MNQKEVLKEIYRTADISPVFRTNEVFALEIGDDIPYISLDDVLENRYIIRVLPEGLAGTFPYTEKGPVLKEYPSLEALANDGWELD